MMTLSLYEDLELLGINEELLRVGRELAAANDKLAQIREAKAGLEHRDWLREQELLSRLIDGKTSCEMAEAYEEYLRAVGLSDSHHKAWLRISEILSGSKNLEIESKKIGQVRRALLFRVLKQFIERRILQRLSKAFSIAVPMNAGLYMWKCRVGFTTRGNFY